MLKEIKITRQAN